MVAIILALITYTLRSTVPPQFAFRVLHKCGLVQYNNVTAPSCELMESQSHLGARLLVHWAEAYVGKIMWLFCSLISFHHLLFSGETAWPICGRFGCTNFASSTSFTSVQATSIAYSVSDTKELVSFDFLGIFLHLTELTTHLVDSYISQVRIFDIESLDIRALGARFLWKFSLLCTDCLWLQRQP